MKINRKIKASGFCLEFFSPLQNGFSEGRSRMPFSFRCLFKNEPSALHFQKHHESDNGTTVSPSIGRLLLVGDGIDNQVDSVERTPYLKDCIREVTLNLTRFTLNNSLKD